MAESRASIAALLAVDLRGGFGSQRLRRVRGADVDYSAVQRAMTRCGINRWSKIPGDARAKLERVEAQAAAAG